MSNLRSWQERARLLKEKKDEAQQSWDQANQPDDITEVSDRCGMDSRHTLSGVVLVETDTGDEWGVQYHWVCAPIKFIATRGIIFQFENEAGLFDVEISGDGSEASVEKLRMISRQISWSKRALISVNGTLVKAIRISQVEEPTEDT